MAVEYTESTFRTVWDDQSVTAEQRTFYFAADIEEQAWWTERTTNDYSTPIDWDDEFVAPGHRPLFEKGLGFPEGPARLFWRTDVMKPEDAVCSIDGEQLIWPEHSPDSMIEFVRNMPSCFARIECEAMNTIIGNEDDELFGRGTEMLINVIREVSCPDQVAIGD